MGVQVLYQYWQQGEWIIPKWKRRKSSWWLVCLPIPALHSYLWIQECLWSLLWATGGLKDLSMSQNPSHCKCGNTTQTGQERKETQTPDPTIEWDLSLSGSRISSEVNSGPSKAGLSSGLDLFPGNLSLSWWQQSLQQPQAHVHSA